MSKKRKKVGVYQFINFVVGERGQPFSICEHHLVTKLIVPDSCTLHKLADKSCDSCVDCDDEEFLKNNHKEYKP